MQFLKSIPFGNGNEVEQTHEDQEGVTSHRHLTFNVTIFKEHDHKHPLTLNLAFTPQVGDAQRAVFATCPCSTAFCRSKSTWLNAYEPHVSATINMTPTPDGEFNLDPLEDFDLHLSLDFAKRRAENSKFEDEGDLWDANALLQLTLTNLSSSYSTIRRGFFKNADLNGESYSPVGAHHEAYY